MFDDLTLVDLDCFQEHEFFFVSKLKDKIVRKCLLPTRVLQDLILISPNYTFFFKDKNLLCWILRTNLLKRDLASTMLQFSEKNPSKNETSQAISSIKGNISNYYFDLRNGCLNFFLISGYDVERLLREITFLLLCMCLQG